MLRSVHIASALVATSGAWGPAINLGYAQSAGDVSATGDIDVETPREPVPMTLEIGPYGGVFIPSSDHELFDATQATQTPFDPVGAKAGLRLGFYPLRFLGAELEGGYSPISNRRGEQNHIFDGRLQGVLQLPGEFSPFMVVGAGFLGVQGDRGGDLDEAFHWGAGLKWFAEPNLNLRLDGRHIVASALGERNGNTNHFEMSLGVGFRLNAPAETQPDLVRKSQTEPESAKPTEAIVAQPSTPVANGEALAEVRQVEVVLERTMFAEAMDPIRFRSNSAKVPRRFRIALIEVGGLLLSRPELDVVVVGHCDSRGPEAYNQKLSEQRAAAVGRFVEARGVEGFRIRTLGKGELFPVASNATASGRAKNRRTEITVVESARGLPPRVMEAKTTLGRAPDSPQPPPGPGPRKPKRPSRSRKARLPKDPLADFE